MNNRELMLECMKMGLALTSPSSHDRHKIVAETGKFLYSEIIAVETNFAAADTPKDEATVRRGRPPKPRAE
jgi:hypothetical protein